jgi:hypothetical protein
MARNALEALPRGGCGHRLKKAQIEPNSKSTQLLETQGDLPKMRP